MTAPTGEVTGETLADERCTCGERPYTGHLLWCEALRGQPEFRPRVRVAEVTGETITDAARERLAAAWNARRKEVERG